MKQPQDTACNSRFTGLEKQSGAAALAAVLITMTLLSVISYQVMDYYSQKALSLYNNGRFESRRDAMILAMRRNVRSGILMFASVQGRRVENDGLYRCLFHEMNDPVNDCAQANLYDVSLYDEDGNKLTGFDQASGVCYKEDGQLVTQPSDHCMFRIWTKFRPRCKNGAAACNVAMGLDYTIDVEFFPTGGIARKARTVSSYASISDAWRYGMWTYISYDFQTTAALPYAPECGAVGSGNWCYQFFWWHGQDWNTVANPTPADLPCINVTLTGPFCGDTLPGFGSSFAMPPPGVPWDPPYTAQCGAGQTYRNGVCVSFTL